ncbi:hypothetical protein [Pseudofrankia sp. DC12]|nr:hypothetical protein [Pseudofrankia sp. DC12]
MRLPQPVRGKPHVGTPAVPVGDVAVEAAEMLLACEAGEDLMGI